jgi:thioredoxin 1|tara:strand:- start:581 stop:898 length:318 start_codon:yes stop_codon:yes gene_type:complete
MVKLITDLVELQNIFETNSTVIIDFTAKWCGPCQDIAPVFEELSKKNPGITCIKIDVDNENTKEICSLCEVNSMPTFIAVKNGTIINKIVGASRNSLVSLFTSAS